MLRTRSGLQTVPSMPDPESNRKTSESLVGGVAWEKPKKGLGLMESSTTLKNCRLCQPLVLGASLLRFEQELEERWEH